MMNVAEHFDPHGLDVALDALEGTGVHPHYVSQLRRLVASVTWVRAEDRLPEGGLPVMAWLPNMRDEVPVDREWFERFGGDRAHLNYPSHWRPRLRTEPTPGAFG